MKKALCLYIIAAIGMIACNKQPDKKTEQSVSELRNYIDSLKTDNTYVNEDQWMGIEQNYEEKKQHVEANLAQLSESQKVDYENLKKEYAELKMKYDAERERARVFNDRRTMLRNALFGEGV